MTLGLDLTSSNDETCDRKSSLHSDLSINFELPNRNSDPSDSEYHREDKGQQGDDGQLVTIPGANEFQPMISSGCHHLGGDFRPGDLRGIKQESNPSRASAA
jgi:hypothetical protein